MTLSKWTWANVYVIAYGSPITVFMLICLHERVAKDLVYLVSNNKCEQLVSSEFNSALKHIKR